MDIIFFAAVALFIFFKLKSQFGKVDEDQKREAIKKFLKEQADITSSNDIKDMQDKELDGKKLENEEKIDSRNKEIFDKLTPKLREDLIVVLEKSRVGAADFVDGASKAFEMIVSAFSSGNKDTLKALLSKDLFTKFASAIDDRTQKNTSLNTNVISIDQIVIKDAKLQNSKALISVNFISKQISYVLDEKEELVDGSREDINEISDLWTFSRDTKSKNPNWTIISTKS